MQVLPPPAKIWQLLLLRWAAAPIAIVASTPARSLHTAAIHLTPRLLSPSPLEALSAPELWTVKIAVTPHFQVRRLKPRRAQFNTLSSYRSFNIIAPGERFRFHHFPLPRQQLLEILKHKTVLIFQVIQALCRCFCSLRLLPYFMPGHMLPWVSDAASLGKGCHPTGGCWQDYKPVAWQNLNS